MSTPASGFRTGDGAEQATSLASPRPAPRAFLVLFAAAVALRLALLAADAHPRFFFGDSESYLATRFGRWIPPDRSWLYGLAASWLADTTTRLATLLVLQTLLTAAAVALVGNALLRAGLAAGPVALLLLLASLEPLGLYYDRAVLTDSPGAALLAAGLATALVALRRGSPRLAACAGALLAGAVAMRTALLPPVLWAVLIAAGIAIWPGSQAPAERRHRMRRSGIALALAAFAGLAAYAVATGKVTGRPTSFNPNGGFFLLGAVAPIVEPADFATTEHPAPKALLDATRHRQRDLRNAQLYGPGELVDRLKRDFGDERKASRAAGTAARAAVIRDPAGFLGLVLAQAGEYLTPGLYREQIAVWAGLDAPIPPRLVAELRQRVRDTPAPESVAAPSLALAWLQHALLLFPLMAWCALVLPLLCVLRMPFADPRKRVGLLLVAGATASYIAGVFAFSAEMVPRYLLPLTLLLTLGAGCLLASFRRRGDDRGAERSTG